MFRIFPGNNKCSRIQARDIILEEGTTLEIDAAQGTYEAGNSYDIIVSENTIIKPENIYIKLPREFAQGLRIRAVIQDKFYRLFIESDGEDDVDDEDIDSKK
jgi:hypothetical protein